MATQLIRWLLLGTWMLSMGCAHDEPLPLTAWSQGCIELAPYQQGYRIGGLCCAYLILPLIELDKHRSFVVKANYYTFTGAGFVAIPTPVSGHLSADGRELSVSYSVNSVTTSHRLKLGYATTFCYCGCD